METSVFSAPTGGQNGHAWRSDVVYVWKKYVQLLIMGSLKFGHRIAHYGRILGLIFGHMWVDLNLKEDKPYIIFITWIAYEDVFTSDYNRSYIGLREPISLVNNELYCNLSSLSEDQGMDPWGSIMMDHRSTCPGVHVFKRAHESLMLKHREM